MKIKKLTAYLLMSGMILGTMSSDLYTIKAQAVETIEETEDKTPENETPQIPETPEQPETEPENEEVTEAAPVGEIELSAEQFPDQVILTFAGTCDKDGNALGYVFVITSHEAYGGDLQLALGVAEDGTTNGISFLSLSETAGLGMQADTDEFKSQFSGKNVAQFKYTKSGVASDEEIDALSGATITTNAVTNAVNAGLSYADYLKGGAN